MAVRLRPHHLLCILTHAGHGYSTAFCENFGQIISRLGDGENILVVSGPDDVCAPLLEAEDEPHCRRPSVTARDNRAAMAVSTLLGKAVVAGTRLTLDAALVGRLRQAFARGEIRQACAECEWAALCSRIADSDFDGALLPG